MKFELSPVLLSEELPLQDLTAVSPLLSVLDEFRPVPPFMKTEGEVDFAEAKAGGVGPLERTGETLTSLRLPVRPPAADTDTTLTGTMPLESAGLLLLFSVLGVVVAVVVSLVFEASTFEEPPFDFVSPEADEAAEAGSVLLDIAVSSFGLELIAGGLGCWPVELEEVEVVEVVVGAEVTLRSIRVGLLSDWVSMLSMPESSPPDEEE